MQSSVSNLLLLTINLSDSAAVQAEQIIRRDSINWRLLLEHARIHCIRPQLEMLLRRVTPGLVPEEVMQLLHDLNRENILRQLRGFSAFFEIKETLALKGITVIPFKGVRLAEYYYGNIGDRDSYDVDLFIDVEDLETIKKTMSDAGYVNTSVIRKLRDGYVRDQLCEYNFDKFEGETCIQHIEFHWSSSKKLFRMNIRMDELRSQIINVTFQDKEIKAFSVAADFLLTLMHHGGKEQFAYLKQVNDIAHLLLKSDETDWQWLLDKCRKYHLETVLLTGVRQANMMTGVPVPDVIKTKANSRKITRLAGRRIKMTSYPVSVPESTGYIIRGWLFHIRSRDGLRLKLHLAWNTFRKVLMPLAVPVKWHHLFFNKNIRERGTINNTQAGRLAG